MPKRPRIEITYCRRCGFLLRAGWVAQELLKAFEEEVGEVALQPGQGGEFVVRIDGAVVFSNREQGRFPEPKELKRLVAEAMGSERRFGHSPGSDDL